MREKREKKKKKGTIENLGTYMVGYVRGWIDNM